MNPLLAAFLPTILAIGAITSYEDLKYEKIRNKYVVVAILLAALIHTVLVYSRIESFSELKIQIIYFAVSFILSATMWKFGFWSAGDAKLYCAYTLLIPIGLLTDNKNSPLPVSLIVNSTIPAFLYTVTNLLRKTNTKEKITAIKSIFTTWYIPKLFLFIIGLAWVVGLIIQFFGIPNIYIYRILIIFAIGFAIEKLFKEKTIFISLGLVVLRIIFDYHSLMRLDTLIHIIVFATAYGVVKAFIRNINIDKKVNINKLQPGMKISEAITKSGLPVIPKNPSLLSKKEYAYLPTKKLTRKLIDNMQKEHRRGKVHLNELTLSEKFAFSPFLFLGTLITIVCQGNMIIFLSAAI